MLFVFPDLTFDIMQSQAEVRIADVSLVLLLTCTVPVLLHFPPSSKMMAAF